MANIRFYALDFFGALIFLTFVKSEGDNFIATNDVCEEKEYCSYQCNRLICSKGFNGDYLNYSSEVEDLILCHWPHDTFNLSDVAVMFSKVKNIQIRHSIISHIYGGNSEQQLEFLKTLNLSDINLKNLSLPYLPSLSTLDVSFNLIDEIKEEYLIMMPRLKNLYLSGNPLICSSNMKWLLDNSENYSVDLIDERRTICTNDEYKGKPILGIMKLLQRMDDDCPVICECSLDKVVGDLIPVISVNCDNRNLFHFPKKIPVNTTVLSLRNNQISNVMPLANDKQYWDVKDVHLDYNNIISIDGLEGSYWLNNFRLFSLQGNSIKQIHTYSLDTAFECNQNLMRVYFGFNPWKCDCSFTPGFRELLLKYLKFMKDVNDIRCAYQKNNENSLLPIAELQIAALCVDHSLPLSPLDYLSITFATLTLLILGKLCYDWWHFKRTGKVPWIVANMP